MSHKSAVCCVFGISVTSSGQIAASCSYGVITTRVAKQAAKEPDKQISSSREKP